MYGKEEYRETKVPAEGPQNLNKFWKKEGEIILAENSWAMWPTDKLQTQKWAEGGGH